MRYLGFLAAIRTAVKTRNERIITQSNVRTLGLPVYLRKPEELYTRLQYCTTKRVHIVSDLHTLVQ